VVSELDVARLAGNDKSSKHRKAEDLISKGQEIKILRESDFERIIAR
jgi:DNA polymerase-3 subunit epsilon